MKSCSVSDGLAIFKALGSPVRVQILRLIQEKEGLNIKQIAQSLKIPVTTLSPAFAEHDSCLKRLERSG